MNRQSSTASLPALDKTWYGETPSASQTIPSTPLAVTAPISATLGHSSSGSSVIAAAASQAIAATQQVNTIKHTYRPFSNSKQKTMIFAFVFFCFFSNLEVTGST
jgi:hypothetical protein